MIAEKTSRRKPSESSKKMRVTLSYFQVREMQIQSKQWIQNKRFNEIQLSASNFYWKLYRGEL